MVSCFRCFTHEPKSKDSALYVPSPCDERIDDNETKEELTVNPNQRDTNQVIDSNEAHGTELSPSSVIVFESLPNRHDQKTLSDEVQLADQDSEPPSKYLEENSKIALPTILKAFQKIKEEKQHQSLEKTGSPAADKTAVLPPRPLQSPVQTTGLDHNSDSNPFIPKVSTPTAVHGSSRQATTASSPKRKDLTPGSGGSKAGSVRRGLTPTAAHEFLPMHSLGPYRTHQRAPVSFGDFRNSSLSRSAAFALSSIGSTGSKAGTNDFRPKWR